VATDDGAILARRAKGATELDLARANGGSWTLTILARAPETWRDGAAYGSLYAVDCSDIGLDRGFYVFGARTDPTDQILRMDGFVASGGVVSGQTWAFAIAPNQDVRGTYKIYGKNPAPVGQGEGLVPTLPCLNQPAG
jgi:hypothetical protein